LENLVSSTKVTIKSYLTEGKILKIVDDPQRLFHECQTVTTLKHSNIIQVDGMFEITEITRCQNIQFCLTYKAMVMEKAECDMIDLINSRPKLTNNQKMSMLRQVASALVYLHEEKRIAHNDVKLENVLVFANGVCKLADFEFAYDHSNDHVDILPAWSTQESRWLNRAFAYLEPGMVEQIRTWRGT